MDRISALRNVEEALRAFEDGEADLATTEAQVLGVLRTYATEFEGDEQAELRPFRAVGGPAKGTVVLAANEREARARVAALTEAQDPEVEQV